MPQFSLSWDDYKSNVCGGFSSLQQNGEFVDMTLAADGHFVKVHQMVIALSSSYLKELLRTAQCPHPVLLLNNMSYKTLCLLLEYIYTGEVVVDAENLAEFTKSAKSLHIKGLETSVQLDRPAPYQDYQNESQEINMSSNNNTVLKVVPQEIKSQIIPKTGANFNIKKKIQLSENISRPKITPKEENWPEYSVMEVEEDSGAQDYEDENDHSYEDCVPKKEPTSPKHYSTPKRAYGDVQYSVSIRGNVQLILNRYIYNLTCSTRRGSRRWRCVEYRNRKCDAMLITKDDVVLRRSNPHNHHFHDKKILSKIENNMVFAKLDHIKPDTKDISAKDQDKDNLKRKDDDNDDED